MGIFVLPPELVLRVADFLEPDDVFNLGQASKDLEYLIRFPALCRQVLMAHAPFSPEAVRAQKDGDYARGFRALVKRRNAIRMARPFHVAFLGMGTSFMYTNGVLCYATESGQLRLLDIKSSADHELVIDVFRMLRAHKETIPEFSEPEFIEHKLKPIYYGHEVLACELKLKNNDITRYLIVMRTRTPELLIFEEQPLHDKTLVNTTEKDLFLCHPVRGALWNYWGVRQFDLGTGQWVHSLPFFYTHAPRQDDGITTTIYEYHFYMVSGREPLFRHGPVQTEDGSHPFSYRLAVRAPLAGLPELPLQARITPKVWTKFYSKLLSDDRWEFLRLERDEATGNLVVIQIRLEYAQGSNDHTRTCYKRVMAFPDTEPTEPATTNVVNDTSSFLLEDGASISMGEGLPRMVTGDESNQQGFGSSSQHSQVKTTVHHGDSSSTRPRYNTGECFVRSYFSTSNSFVDLVNDTLRNNGNEQSLRLRVMTEIPGGGNEVVFWPPKQDPSKPDPRLTELHAILNPPGFDGDLEWNVDSGSFVYGMKVSSMAHQKAIIYVGFDPTVKLHHLRAFNQAAKSNGAEASGGQSGSNGKGGPGLSTQGQDGADDEMPRSFPRLGAAWAWLEEPMYFRPKGKNGFDFFG